MNEGQIWVYVPWGKMDPLVGYILSVVFCRTLLSEWLSGDPCTLREYFQTPQNAKRTKGVCFTWRVRIPSSVINNGAKSDVKFRSDVFLPRRRLEVGMLLVLCTLAEIKEKAQLF